MDEASVSYTRKVWDGNDGAYKFLLALCPWRENHTTAGRPMQWLSFSRAERTVSAASTIIASIKVGTNFACI